MIDHNEGEGFLLHDTRSGALACRNPPQHILAEPVDMGPAIVVANAVRAAGSGVQ
jgi:hypothetical protein